MIMSRLRATYPYSLGTSMVLFSTMQSLWQFCLINVLFGIGMTGVGDIVAGSVASKWMAENRRGITLAVVYLGSNVGGMLVPIVAQQIAALYDWRVALQVLGLGGILIILPFTVFLIRDPETLAATSSKTQTPLSPSLPGQDHDLSVHEALRTRSFWVLAFLLFCFYFYYLAVNKHFVAYLSDSGFTDAKAAASFSFAIAVGIIGKLSIGFIADRFSCKTAMLLNFALFSLASILILKITLPGVLPGFLLIHGFAVAAENVLLPLMVVVCFGVRHMAAIYGMLMLMLFPGGILGPILAGYMFDQYQSYSIAFSIFACLNVVAFFSLFLLRPETQRPETQVHA